MNAARQSPGERRRGVRVAGRVAAETRSGLTLVARVWALREARMSVGADLVRLGRQRRTVDDVRGVAAALAIARGPCPAPPGRFLRFAWRGLTLVNVVTLAVVLGRLVGAPDGPSWLSGVLAVGVVGVQVRLAFDLGRRLRPFADRETAAGLSVEAAVEAGALVGLGSLVGTASFTWATGIQEGGAAVLGGLVVVAATLAAPLMVVHDEVYGPGAPGRMLGRCERVLGRVDRRCRRLDGRAERLIDRARRRLRRAEELLVLAADLLGDGDPVVAGLEADVSALRAALTDLDGVAPPLDLDPDDLDLAG